MFKKLVCQWERVGASRNQKTLKGQGYQLKALKAKITILNSVLSKTKRIRYLGRNNVTHRR